MQNPKLLFLLFVLIVHYASGQSLNDTQMRNARATGYAIVAARNPGKSFSIYVVKWNGTGSLEQNANTQINAGWHAQAAVKGNFSTQTFDGSDFSEYSTVITSEEEFNTLKSTGTQWWIVCSTLPPFSNSITTNTNGNVGIGTTLSSNPNGYKLAVKGKIGAQEVQVENTSTTWADYVFEPTYKLMSLTEVDAFVKTNKHLPEIPSAEEVKVNGHKLGEMDVLLLKKVEELTLYMIELKKENEKQQAEIELLKSQINK